MNNYNSQSGFESVEPIEEGREESEKDDDVLLNVSPKKFEKPKDQLFLDFFSMYTK